MKVKVEVEKAGLKLNIQKMKIMDGITDSMDMSLSKLPPGVDGKGSLGCCSPWDHKESDKTERLN